MRGGWERAPRGTKPTRCGSIKVGHGVGTLAASIKQGTVTASLILRKLSSYRAKTTASSDPCLYCSGFVIRRYGAA